MEAALPLVSSKVKGFALDMQAVMVMDLAFMAPASKPPTANTFAIVRTVGTVQSATCQVALIMNETCVYCAFMTSKDSELLFFKKPRQAPAKMDLFFYLSCILGHILEKVSHSDID